MAVFLVTGFFLVVAIILGGFSIRFFMHSESVSGARWPQYAIALLFVLVIIAITVFSMIAWEEQLRQQAAGGLKSTLALTEKTLSLWFELEIERDQEWARSPEVRDAVRALLMVPGDRESLASHPAQVRLQDFFQEHIENLGVEAFQIVAPDYSNLASSRPEEVGEPNPIARMEEGLFSRAFTGLPTLVPAAPAGTGSQAGDSAAILSYTLCPIFDDENSVMALLLLPTAMGHDLSRICELPYRRETKEVYALDANGYFLSTTSLSTSLENAGLLAPGKSQVLHLRVADPGVNIERGAAPTPGAEPYPLTRMAEAITNRTSGSSWQGYRDYRGVEVVGAWQWVPALNLGLACEEDAARVLGTFYTSRSAIVLSITTLLVMLISVYIFGMRQNEIINRKIARARDDWEQLARRRETEIELTHKSLVESEEASRLLLESISEGLYGMDKSGKVTFINRSALYMLGYTEDEVIGQIGHDLFHHSAIDGTALSREECPSCRASHRSEDTRGFETVFWRKDGSHFLVCINALPMLRSGGNVGSVTTFTDITAQKEADLELRKLSRAIETTEAVVIVTDTQGAIEYVNQRFVDLTGYSREEVKGQKPSILGSGVHTVEFYKNLWETILAGESWIGEFCNKKKNGQFYWEHASISPVFDADGEMINFVAVKEDITERRASTERFRVLFESSADPHFIMDRDKVLDCNEAAVKILGASDKREVLFQHPGKFSPEFQPDGQRSGDKLGHIANLAMQKGQHHFDWVQQRLDGGLFTVEVMVTQIHLGSEFAWLVTWHDLTERNRMMSELVKAREDAEAANRAKSIFLATMSHEIRTPMNGVIGTLEVLRQTSLSPEQREMTDIIGDSAEVLMTVINDILDFSKIEAGRMELDSVPVALEEVADAVCNALSARALEGGVRLHYFVDPELPPIVRTDPVRLRQVVANLVSNGIKFSVTQERQAWVSLRLLHAGPNRIRLIVADNGIGMKPSEIETLFTPFAQADGTITRRYGGTGLGLSICKNLTAMLGGELDVQSVYGKGSTFTVTLPIVPCADEDTEAAGRPLEGIVGVVVSPYAETAEDWCAYLRHGGAAMTPCATLEEVAAQGARQGGKAFFVVADCENERIALPDAADDIKEQYEIVAFVRVSQKLRRTLKKRRENEVVLCRSVISRRALVDAMALAAGRLQHDPLYSVRDSKYALSAPSIQEAMQRGQLILVAEDNEMNQKVIRYQLGTLGYACELASNGKEALELWHSGRFAMLITDIHMPVMDGYALAREIREQEQEGQHLTIVALTASISRDELSRCMDAGMDGHLTKPVPLDAFKKVLDRWLGMVPMPASEPARDDAMDSEAEDITESPVLFDPTALTDMVGVDPAFAEEFLGDYKESALRTADEIGAAYADRNWEKLGALAHRLKSSSRSVGAMRLGDYCARLELAGKTGDDSAVARLMPQFEACIEETLSLITVQGKLDDVD
jgi:two-component system, sensor histidine kinase and response regulator